MNELALNQNIGLKNKVEGIIRFYNIDPQLFKYRLAERLMFSSVSDIEHKENYFLAIVRAMIKEEHLENTAKVKKYGISLLDLCNEMRELGIKVDPKETRLMEIYFQHIKGKLNPESIKSWVETAISYTLNSKRTSTEFISLFKRTQTMKALNLNYEEIENQYKMEMEQWKQITN